MALMQIVEWDPSLSPADIFAWRYVDPKNPDRSDALGNWTQLVVQESQEAILFRDGQALDLFGPGRHTLSTDNIPLLRRLINLPTGGKTPFKAHVWFVNKLNILDVKWGTLSPLLLRDPEYQIPIPVRAYGQFGVRIRDSRKFLLKLVGTRTRLTRDELIDSFRGLLLSRIGDMVASYITLRKINIFDISAYLKDMSDEAVEEVRPVFEEYGIEPTNFFLGSVNVPEDDEAVQDLKKAMSERARMNVMGYNYQQMRSFDAMEEMAQASGSGDGGGGGNPLLGAGIGLGAGLGMGGAFGQMASQMGQFLNSSPTGAQQQPVPTPAAPGGPATPSPTPSSPSASRACPKCGKACGEGRFCPSCGASLTPSCPHCGAKIDADARFCSQCGKPIPRVCECGAALTPDAAFCSQCGRSLEGKIPQN